MNGAREDSDETSELDVWRAAPDGAPRRYAVQTLPLERIDPVIRVAHRRSDGAHLTFPERVIVDHEIVLVLSGKGDLRFRDRIVPFAAHELLFLRPFVPHTFAGRGDVDHIAVHFDFSPRAVEANLTQRRPYTVSFGSDLDLPVKQRTVPHGAVERSLALVVKHAASGTKEGKLRARGEFLCALSVLLTAHDRPRGELGRRRAQVEHAVALMRQRLSEPLTSADLQRASGLGSSQLTLLFRE
ncbi:MAG TPA: AraC family ligand binding domain-containing protein, partial [Polyangiaceae bacterium]|nr:AraC family ligand binding domain-containing protein [Polyangiaceae bacterium]